MSQRKPELDEHFAPESSFELANYVVVVLIQDDHLLLLSEECVKSLEGKVYCRLAEAVSGGATYRDICLDLAPHHSFEEIRDGMQVLIDLGAVLNKPSQGTTEEQAYWESLGREYPDRTVSTRLICNAGQGILFRALEGNGLKIGESGDLLIVTTDDYLRPELADINRNEKRPWLLAKPIGHTIWIGPLIVPGRTACWACLAHWLKTNRWQQAAFFGWGDEDFSFQPSVAALPGTLALAAGMIATAAAVWSASGSYESLEDGFVAFDTRKLHQARHPVRRRPQCPVCGHGTLSVREHGLYELVSPLTGIVSAMDVTDHPAGGFFHARGRFVLPLPVLRSRSLLKPGVSSGKGVTGREAEINCIAEAVERYSATYQGIEQYVQMRFDSRISISPANILLFSKRQYRHRALWNEAHSEEQWIPEEFDPERPILWTPARGLGADRTLLVPAGCAYLWYPFADEARYAMPDSNGCASGKTLEEAILYALLELIERDAVSIWWYNRLRRPSIHLESFAHPIVSSAHASFKAMGRELYLIDVTSDLDIPVYVAVAPRQDGSEPFFGCAAHKIPALAAGKAIAELAQIWFWHTYGNPDQQIDRWIRNANCANLPYLEPLGASCAPPLETHDEEPADALRRCVSRLLSAGIEPLWIDLTRADIGVPTARVIAPGLRHFWARFAPGRLYDVPVKMGWLPKALAEEELNPTPCFL